MNFDATQWSEWAELVRSAWRILLVWLLASVCLWLVRRVLRVMKTHFLSRIVTSNDNRRIDTLMSVVRYTSNIVIISVAIMLTLGTLGISVAPILATAGVAGIAVGFGAQSLVKDFFTGFFLLIEDQVSEGDVIEAAGKSGYVERVTLRHVRVRDYDGSVHFIPNSMITTVTNRSRDYAYAIIDLNVKRQDNLEKVFATMERIGGDMRRDAVFGPSILDDLDIAGVEKVDDASIALRCRFKVRPSRQWRIRREFLRRMKLALDPEEVRSAA